MLLAGLSLYLTAFGLLYGTRLELMPHHDAATPDDVTEQILPLYRTLMRLTGAAATALGIISLYIVLGPLRAGVKGAALVVCLCLTGFFAATALAAAQLQAVSGATTHWPVMAGLAALTVFAFGLHRFAVSCEAP